MKNNINEKIKESGNLILYTIYLKQSYDFCTNYNRYNYYIINNLNELAKNQLFFLEKKFAEIERYILKLSQSIYKNSIKNDNMRLIPNKNGIKIKDQVIKNSNNNIKINPELNNEKNENKKIVIKKYIFENGEYEGDNRDGLPHGLGTYKYKNGDEYSGEFKNGLFDGNGELKTRNGEYYQGQFKKGQKEGKGVYKNKNGESYCGYWKDDKKDGQGKYTFPNGDFYQGEFREDMYNGLGALFYSNGNKTYGMWKNNKRNGNEYLFNNRGEIFFHSYENNTLIQEKKLDVNNLHMNFKDFTEEKIIEYLNIIYIDQFKRNSTNTRYNMKADNIIKLIKSPGTPTARLLSFISFNCIVKG